MMRLEQAFDVLSHVTVNEDQARRKPKKAPPTSSQHIKRYGRSIATRSTVIRKRNEAQGIDQVQNAVAEILKEENLTKIADQIKKLMHNNHKDYEYFFKLFEKLAKRAGELTEKADEHMRISKAYKKSVNALYDAIDGIRSKVNLLSTGTNFASGRLDEICEKNFGLKPLSTKTS